MKFLGIFRIFMFISVSVILLTCGCVEEKKEEKTPEKTTEKTPEEKAISSCIELCKNYALDLKRGPCLSENISEDWVCDAAHNPREEIDNDPENQCSAYREGKANHFVEVDTKCALIRAV